MRSDSSSFTARARISPDPIGARPGDGFGDRGGAVRWIVAIIGVLALACGSSPEADDAAAYVAAVEPALRDNARLAQRFLTDASLVKRGTTDGGKLAEELARDLAPEASALAKAVAEVHPDTPALSDTHATLVKAWTDRSAAYGAMSDAWAAGDLAAWDAAVKKNTQSKIDEERYFTEVNRYLAAYELRLEQYPE